MPNNTQKRGEDYVEDEFQAFLVNGAEFTKNEEYPIIRPEMVPKDVPKKIMHFSKAITFQGDLKETVIYFFSPDKTFERVRRNPKRYVSFFKRTAGIIGFDFSVHTDMPLIKQKSQLNDNLSLTYYYASQGIPVYPSVRFGSDSTVEEYLKAFPHNTLLAIGVHGFIQKLEQKYETYFDLKKIIDELHPTGLIIIGHLSNAMFNQLKEKTPFYFYDAFIEERQKEVKKYGN